MAAQKLGEILLEMRTIDRFQLATALGLQTTTGTPLGRIVVDQWFGSANDVLKALSKQVGLPVVELGEKSPAPSVTLLLPREVALSMRAVPFGIAPGAHQRLRIAVSAPGPSVDLSELQSGLESATQQEVELYLAWDDAVEQALATHYSIEIKPGLPSILVAGWSREKTNGLLAALVDQGFTARTGRHAEALTSAPDEVLVCPAALLLSFAPYRRVPPAKIVVWAEALEEDRQALAASGAHGFLVEARSPTALAKALTAICAQPNSGE